MVKVDLITGFLGSGKTTFIKKYARYLMEQGQNIGILENDFGAINVDMMLLRELEGENCELEMVAGGCDKDCYRRRFKTKLIAMGMCGYDRVLIEPSGIFMKNHWTAGTRLGMGSQLWMRVWKKHFQRKRITCWLRKLPTQDVYS